MHLEESMAVGLLAARRRFLGEFSPRASKLLSASVFVLPIAARARHGAHEPSVDSEPAQELGALAGAQGDLSLA
jgi:hypothetical protein